MVSTRATRASFGHTTSPPLKISDDPRAQKEARKLNIDAFETLSGAKVERKADEKTYRSRGGGYVWTSDTKEEWIDQGSNKRKRESGVSVREGGNVDAEDTERRPVKRRRRSGVVVQDDSEDEMPITAFPPPPRTASSHATGKRRRRTSDRRAARQETTSSPTSKRAKRRDSARDTGRAEDEIPDEPPPFLKPDRTTLAGHGDLRCTQEAEKRERIRDEQRRLGRDVDPIPANKMRAITDADREEGQSLQTLKHALARDSKFMALLRDMGKVNKQYVGLWRAKMETDAKYRRVLEKKSSRESDASEEDVGEPDSRHDSAASLSPPQTADRVHETISTTAVASSSPRNADVDENDANAEDEVNPTLPNDIPESAYAPLPSIPTPPLPTLPQTNKAGHPLRWSLPATSTTEGRAESAITFKRMEGESHSARRRRVKRELKVLARWPLVGVDGE